MMKKAREMKLEKSLEKSLLTCNENQAFCLFLSLFLCFSVVKISK